MHLDMVKLETFQFIQLFCTKNCKNQIFDNSDVKNLVLSFFHDTYKLYNYELVFLFRIFTESMQYIFMLF